MAGIVRREINIPSSGIVVTGASGKRIRVLAAAIAVNNGVATWKFQSSPNSVTGTDEEYTGAADLTGNIYLASGSTSTGDIVLPYNPEGWLETRESDDLGISLSGSGLGGCIVCQMIDA
jgi:hypothetical protein